MAELFQKGIVPLTKRTYGSAKGRYIGCCRRLGRPPLPTSEARLCQFVALLAREGLAHGSIRGYLSAVQHLQREAGWGDPGMGSMAKLEQVLRGVKRLRAEEGKQKQQRKPMTLAVMGALRTSWSRTPVGRDSRMLWATATLCFFGFFRSGEVTIPSMGGFDKGAHLCWEDIATDSLTKPTLLRDHLKASKTDQARKGCTLVVGSTGDKMCPVAAVLEFMAEAGPRNGPLFQYDSGKSLTQTGLVAEVKAVLERGGVCSKGYSGHSFQIGAATTAVEAGVSEAVIQQLGRWKSVAYKGYIRLRREQLAGIPRGMVDSDKKRKADC